MQHMQLNLKEVHHKDKDSRTFNTKKVKGKKEVLRDGQIHIVVKTGPLSKDVYTYANPEDAAIYMFDNHDDAYARLLEMEYGGAQ